MPTTSQTDSTAWKKGKLGFHIYLGTIAFTVQSANEMYDNQKTLSELCVSREVIYRVFEHLGESNIEREVAFEWLLSMDRVHPAKEGKRKLMYHRMYHS